MKIKKLNYNEDDSLNDLKKLLSDSPVSRNTFRYFEKRSLFSILNHVYTALYYNENQELIGYGHLDGEDGKIWLGILVSDNYQNLGYGNFIMDDLLGVTDEPIFLSVDINNIKAQNLYKKKNFVQIESDSKKIIMLKK
jgi:ribosomal protein S18 acetylase RimI-like enzyme